MNDQLTGARWEIGVRWDVPAIPPIEENTIYFEAGSILFGLENRILSPDIVGAHRAGDHLSHEELAKYDDGGLSVHVFDASSRFEHLRFDLFNKDPHYHYLYPDYLLEVSYDRYSNGDMWNWVMTCLRHRLAPMLQYASAGELANSLDEALVDSAAEELAAARENVLSQRESQD
jgi:hypothetical protein